MAIGPWTDPKESDTERWTGVAEPTRRGASTRSVPERAAGTAPPYRRRGTATLAGDTLRDLFETRSYTRARLGYDATVLADGRLRLLVKGYLWGPTERHQRYRVQHRREAPPTATVPFDEYETWARYQFGRVEERENDGDDATRDDEPSFVPETPTTDETRTLEWDRLFPLHRRLLAELELVRNPAFAEYRLRERDEWADVRDDLKWDVDAFAVGP